MSIGVLGTGAFGTALAISLVNARQTVTIWGRDNIQINMMRSQRENVSRLPGVPLPIALRVTDTISVATDNPIILLAVPMQQLRGLLKTHAGFLAGRSLVACCKGVEAGTNQGPASIIAEVVPSAKAAILTGPSFANDIARGLPTALALACADEAALADLQRNLTTPNIRVYRTTDVIGAELAGALKNVIAIACGAAIGAGLGDSARAALMTRGYAEMSRMAAALGGRAETMAGLAGFGDLSLTCSSEQSRNYRYGLALGRAETFGQGVTVEGVATARAALDRANQMGIDMPITQAVVALIDRKLDIHQAMELLLSRPLKEETPC